MRAGRTKSLPRNTFSATRATSISRDALNRLKKIMPRSFARFSYEPQDSSDISCSVSVAESLYQQAKAPRSRKKSGSSSSSEGYDKIKRRSRQDKNNKKVIENLTMEVETLKNNLFHLQPKSSLNSCLQAMNIEKIDPPSFKQRLPEESLVPFTKEHILHSSHMKLFRDLKTVLNLKFKKNSNICDFLRSSSKLISSVSNEVDAVTYNLLIFDSLNEDAKSLVSHYLHSPLETISAPELHEILIHALGSSIDPIGRKTTFFAYDPLQDGNLKKEDLNLSNVLHAIRILGLKANTTNLEDYQKVLSILPPASQVELKSLVRGEQRFDPSYIPSISDILKLLRDSTGEIEIQFKQKKSDKLKNQKREIFAIESKIEPIYVQNYEQDKNVFGSSKQERQKINPNSYSRKTPRQYDGKQKTGSNSYCLNCLMSNHTWQYCGFTNLACQLCLSEKHPTPECPVYPNSTAVPTACFYCRSKLGKKVHHPSGDCLLAKESEISEIAETVSNSLNENNKKEKIQKN